MHRESGVTEGILDALPGGPVGTNRARSILLWYFAGVPLVTGFLFGWQKTGRADAWPVHVSLVYWIGAAALTTALFAACTRSIAPLMRRAGSPLWLTLFVAQLGGGFLLLPPTLNAWLGLLQGELYPGISATTPLSPGGILYCMPMTALTWVGVNLLFFSALRTPMYGYAPPGDAGRSSPGLPPGAGRRAAADTADRAPEDPASGPPAPSVFPADAASAIPTPAFMERVRPDRRGALLALQADGHYMHVHTDAGSDVILYRFSDAMLDVEQSRGMRVHRSWWIAERALAPRRKRDVVVLSNGMEVPVSRSYRVIARQRGWLA